jgi:hypothetical protein
VFRAAGRRAVRQVVIREAIFGSTVFGTLLLLARGRVWGISESLTGQLRGFSDPSRRSNRTVIANSLLLFAV